MGTGFRQYPVDVTAIREGSMRWPLWRVAVAERSMEPALRPGDWLLVRRSVRPGRPPRVRPGQVVIAQHPTEPGLLLVKRAARRADGGWWLESDNRTAGAVDSRSFGAIPGELIHGRVLLRYWRGRAGPGTAADGPAGGGTVANGPQGAEDPRP
jgi:nickel-type superoxide dismutase maturation protease